MALLRTDPFRDVDRMLAQLWGGTQGVNKTWSMPLDAYRKGEQFLVRIDLPGVKPDDVDITVEDNVLTVKAVRPVPELSGDVETLASERVYGSFSRQLFLGRNLDTARIEARYEDGVLNLVIPVAEHARPRRIEISADANASSASTAEIGHEAATSA